MSSWKLPLSLRKRKDWVPLVPQEAEKLTDLSHLAKKLGLEQKQVFSRNNRSTRQVINRFRNNSRQISAGIEHLARKKKHQSLTPTEKWLFENKTIILETAENVSSTLTPQLLSRLPNLKSNLSKIRALEIITCLISNSDHHLNYHRIKKFILDYQTETHLTIAELWAIPLVAQAVLLDSINNIFYRHLESEPTIKNIVLGLRNIHQIDWNDFVEELSTMEKILRHDPAGVYPLMDFRTRDIYRHNIEEIHFQTGHEQDELARWVVNQAAKFRPNPGLYPKNHLGYYLLGPGRSEVEKAFLPKRKLLDNLSLLLRQRPVKIYFLTLWGTTLLVLYLSSFLQLPPALWLLALFPAFYLANLSTHLVMVRFYPPIYSPKMNSDLPVTEKDRTMVLVPTILLPNPKQRAELLAKLEENFSNNRDPNIFFAVALAWPETTRPNGQPTQEELDTLKSFKKDLSDLNHKYPHPEHYFHLFFRNRVWNPGEQSFIEWERKRGKIMEFVRLLRGATNTSFSYTSAKPEFLSTIKYVITLDDDITIPRDTAKKLIATISHPLNRPIIDQEKQVVTAGYGIIQPRISTQLPSPQKTLADYVFASDSGWDSYSMVASSTYQDIFRESFFLGRGIFDVSVFDQILSHRFPENTLLSHDHIEGFYCRTGFASDIQIFETYPKSYFSYYSRLHRWVRGDWQRFFWLFPWVKNQEGRTVKNPLLFFQRWKLADDMIQNLTLPASLLLCLVLIFLSPQNQSLGLFILLIVTLTQPFVSFIESLPLSKNLLRAWRHYSSIVLENFRAFLVKFVFNLIFSFHQSLVICHAIATALIRTLVTKKKRLEWAIFLQTNIKDNDSLVNNFYQTLPSQILLLALLLVSLLLPLEQRALPTSLLLLWLSTPLAISVLNRIPEPKPIFSPNEKQHLRIIARKTWRFFDNLVTKSSHFLPPDHFQQTTPVPVSTRTSATDIGLYLTSAVSALDLGLISLLELLDRSQKTLSTMAKLETLNGHFFNWYDIKSLKPLPPGYISTVDSGNLACGLLTLHQALKDLSSLPLISQKVIDTIDDLFFLAKKESDPSLSDHLSHVQDKFHGPPPPETLTQWFNSLTTVSAKIKHLRTEFMANPLLTAKTDKDNETIYWLTKTIQFLDSQARQLAFFAPWIDQLGFQNPLLDHCQTILELKEKSDNLKKLRSADKWIRLGTSRINRFLEDCHRQSRLAKSLAMNMDFSFLYDPKQNLFRIGYSLFRRSFDQGHYDLLASEARTTSLFAIAKYDVPLKHWSSLARPMSLYHNQAALLSWGGSIFEYLMPSLFLPKFPQTLLWETYQTIIQCHMDYAAANKIPWGISESSYGLVNKDGHYRYKLHGVPDFGLRQFPTKDLVVSPYSVFVSLELVPHQAYKNILRLEAEGLNGKFGLFDAIDYTNYEPNKLNDRVIRTFLCHHQGIILAAIANSLENSSIRHRFSSFEPVLSHLTLLQEKIPVHVSFTTPQTPPETDISEEQTVIFESPTTQTYTVKSTRHAPQFNLLSNGRFKTFLTNKGAGFNAYREVQLTRWQNDPTLGILGHYIYLRDISTQKVWSASLAPTSTAPEKYAVSSTEGAVKINRHNWEIETNLITAVPSNEDIEIQSLYITNHSDKKRQLEVTNYSEIVLNNASSDQSHPTFSKMRLASELVENPFPTLIFRRAAAATPGLEPLVLACRLVSANLFQKTLVETDRQAFLGRSGSLILPRGIITLKGTNHLPKFSLDPIACFQTKVALDPNSTTQLCFLQTVAGSKETALANITKYSSIDTIKEALLIAQTRGAPDLFAPLSHKTVEQLLACLFLGKGLSQNPLSYNQVIKLARREPQEEIDWNLPLITILVGPSTHPSFLNHSLNLCYFLAYQGFLFKIIILAFDRDNYYQATSNQVSDTVNNFETLVVNNNLVSPSISILRSHNLSPMAIRFITATSSVTLNGNKKSTVAQQINLAFKRL